MARGINNSGDIISQTLDGVSLRSVWDEYQATLGEWNAGRSPYVALLTTKTTASGQIVSQAVSGDDFERASEFGAPKSSRGEAVPLAMGFPLEWWDQAARYTKSFLRDATASQVAAVHAAALEADNRLVFGETLRALMTKTTVASRPVNSEGATIFSLWDGEVDSKPPAFAGRTFTSSHSHYLVSGAATVDGGDLRDLAGTITEHGFGIGANERVVIVVHPSQGEVIRGFRAGVDGSPYDFIPSESAPAYLSTEYIVGDKPPAQIGGLTVIGAFGKALVVEDYFAIKGYLVATAIGGRTPLAFREHVSPEYRGLRLTPGGSTVPILESHYERGFGISVLHRSAAAVMQIKASGSYDTPNV